MKSKCSFILKASLSLVLALLMLFGTVATSVAAVVDTADTGADSADVADTGADAEDIADTGAEADLADTSYGTSQLKQVNLKKGSDSYTAYSISGSSVTVNITTTGTYYFNVEMTNNDKLTNNGNISNSISGWALSYKYDNSNDCTLTVSTTGNYTFSFTESSGTIYMSVGFPTQAATEATEAAVSGSGTDLTPTQYLYLDTSSFTGWEADARFAMVYWTGGTFANPSGEDWINGSKISDHLYRFTLPASFSPVALEFERMNGSQSENNWNEGNKWNSSTKTTMSAGSDIWEITNWTTGQWKGTGYGYTISSAVSPSGSGTVTKTDDNAGVDDASTGEFTATAKAGYVFSNWTIPTGVTLATGYSNTNRTIKFNADRAATLTANFGVAYTVTLPSIENATVTATYTYNGSQTLTEGNSVTVPSGTSFTISVAPATNYKVTNIQGTAKTALGTQTQSVTVTANTIISAIVEEKTKYTVTTANNDTSLGTITVSPNTTAANYKDTITVYEGATVYYKATPLNGKLTKIVRKNTTANTQLYSNTYNRITVLSTSFIMPSGNVEVAATFQDYVGTSKYYYDGWKNTNSDNYAVSSGSGLNNVQMTEGLYNGQTYSYIHFTTSRDSESSVHKFSISKKESGTRYVYYNDHGSWNDGEYWRQSYGGAPVAVFLDINGKQLASPTMTWVSGSGDAVDKIWKCEIPNDERVYQVYFTNGKSTNWRRTEYTNIDHGLYERSSWSDTYSCYSVNWNNGWGTSYNDAGGIQRFYWGSPSGTDQTYESDLITARFGSDIVLSYADIGSHTGNTSMVSPKETPPTDYYIIVYYPSTDYGTINGVTANNTNSYPIVVASTDLPSTAANRATIYAKDGTINEGRNTTRVIGETDVEADGTNVKGVVRGSISYTENNTSKTLECYTSARATKGESITVTTTVADGYASKYYVKGWDVNGTTYGLDPKAVGNAYSATFTVPNAEKVEITPIYWLKSGSVATFFVKDFNKVPAEWGGALYYYFWGGSQVAVDDEEKYPGQPFVHEGGQYYTQVPTDVTGITLNNAVWDTIHGQNIMGKAGSESANHYQTYDFDNFAKINKEKSKINSIYFTFKYETKKNNFDYNSGGSSITIADFNDSNGNGWEQYKDPLGRDNNIFGGTDVSGSGVLYAVSNGYARNYQGNLATEWSIYYASSSSATTATRVATLPGSALILDSTGDFSNYSDTGYGPVISDYQTAWNTLNTSYSTCPVYITYEECDYNGYTQINTSGKKPANSGGSDSSHKDEAFRIDGKWDYTTDDDYVTADIIIQLSDDNGVTYTTDAFKTGTNEGTKTGAEAYFNNDGEDYQNKHEVTVDDEIAVSTTDKFSLKTVPKPSTGYQFVGWYRLDDGSATPELIAGSTEATSLMSAKATFIARYKFVTEGNLVINHVASGTGKSTLHTVKAEIFNSGDDVSTATPIAKFEGESATIDDTYIKSSSTYKIRVTLTARADSGTSYIANTSATPTVACSQAVGTYYKNPSYSYSGRFEESVYPVNVVTTVDTFNISSLFSNNKQSFQVLNYTTTFNKLPTYTINYKYHGRNMTGSDYLTFARTITLSHDEAEGKTAAGEIYSGNNGTALRPTYITTDSDGLVNDITANAPNQNDLQTQVFNKNIAWSVPDTVTADSLVVYATETDPTYTLTYSYVDASGDTQTGKTVTAKYDTLISLGDKIGTTTTYATVATNGSQKFAYWADAEGNPLTSTLNYKMRLINDITIHPVYGDPADGWTAAIDKITRTHETSDTSDYIFTDFALRFSGFDENGSFIHINPDYKAKYKVGVAVVYDTAGNNTTETDVQKDTAFYNLSQYTDAKTMIQTLVNRELTTAKLSKVSATTYVSMCDADNNLLTNFNRIDYALKYNYNTYYKRSYDAYAYIIDTSTNTVLHVSPVKSGYLYDGKLPSGAGN